MSHVSDSKLFVRIDERSLAFTALGAASSGQLQAIITTSGTAVANLHPAVLEAHHSGIPLILLTADRPAELRGKGANQTTNQVGIFNDAVIECIDVAAPTEQDVAELPGRARDLVKRVVELARAKRQPVQLNLQFIEPLSATEPVAAEIYKTLNVEEIPVTISDKTSMQLSNTAVVIAGASAEEHREEIAQLGLPVFAEPSSGVRDLGNSISNYRKLLADRNHLFGEINQIVVYGKPTLSRPVISLLKSENIEVLVRPGRMGNFQIPEVAKNITAEITNPSSDASWLQLWLEADEPNPSVGFNRQSIIHEVYESAPEVLVFGASQLIREADFCAPKLPVRVWANRGLSGIDGTIATATGIALTGKKTVALMGDLTFLHDVGSLVIDPQDVPLNLKVVVVNDHGGKIFEALEVAKTSDQSAYDRVFRTGQQFEMHKLAEGFGWEYERATSLEELRNSLNLPGRVLVEIVMV